MKLSVKFVQQKHEAIQYLKGIFASDQDKARQMFPVLMNKIRVELKGEEVSHTFTRRDGREVTATVVMFPDKSFASRPKVRELTNA